jgi:hypothetical protein
VAAKKDPVIEEYADRLASQPKPGSTTVEAYRSALTRLRPVLGPLEKLTEGRLRSYQRKTTGISPATWNGSVYTPLRMFWKWYSAETGRPDPTGVLRRRKEHPIQRSTRGLAAKLATLEPVYRNIARLVYLTGLELGPTFALIERRSTGSHIKIPGRGGKTLDVHLEPEALKVLEELRARKLTERQKRNTQRRFRLAGFEARDLVAASRLHRGARESKADVVAPTLALLMDHPELDNVSSSFESALLELRPGGEPNDSITDAAGALQTMLEKLGARGNSLGDQIRDLRKRELFAPHDSNLADAIEALVHWVNADRSERGDAHGERVTLSDDAWLTVRVVGALLIRLEKHSQSDQGSNSDR